MAQAAFSIPSDMGTGVVDALMNGNRGPMMRHAVSTAHHAIGLRPADMAAQDRIRRMIHELAINAVQHVTRRSVALPWNLSVVRDGSDALWTIADDGPGILGRFREAWGFERARAHYGDGDALLDAIIHERLTSFSGDPNAGLGIQIALRQAMETDTRLRLATDGRLLELHDGRMIRTGTAAGSGTVWTVRIPMMPRRTDA